MSVTRRSGDTVSPASGTGAGGATGAGRSAMGRTTPPAPASTTSAAATPRLLSGNSKASTPTATITRAPAVRAAQEPASPRSDSAGTAWR